jgi:hypothetical protein
MSPRAQTEKTTSELKTLRHREAELVRRMVIVSERRAFFPSEVSERQVEELSRKLDDLRSRIATIEAQMPADLAW